MRINTTFAGVVLPALIAGVIYFVIAFTTGASGAAAIIDGFMVAIVAIVIGFLFRAVYIRRASRRR